ncbi:MAG: endonuclease [Pseudomonadota bacterium]
MATSVKNIEGNYYPIFNCGWGGCAEELFHYTSRYYTYTEVFLRNLSDDRSFSMVSYNARQLSSEQKELMAAVLACKPDKETASTIIKLVTSVRLGKSFVSQSMVERYRKQIECIPKGVRLVYRRNLKCPEVNDLSPLDPFLNIAERLRLPVAVKEHHVEVSLGDLAEHLDSPVSSMRINLQNAVLRLHAAGYLLRNHPGLTHEEAKSIADEDAV